MFCRLCLIVSLSALVLAAKPANSAGVAGNSALSQHCSVAAVQASAAQGLPAGLLNAISLAETGRWDGTKEASFAWPWTVTAGGKGKFFPTKSAAIAHVEQLKRDGVRNIDVGCMQINLMYHPQAFADLGTAFDPGANTRYAARFLAGLKRETQSWPGAIGRYHSATPARARHYLGKVTRLWLGENQALLNRKNETQAREAKARREAAVVAEVARREAAELHRAAVIARFLSRRAERVEADAERS